MYGTGWKAAIDDTLITPPDLRATIDGNRRCASSIGVHCT